MSRIVRAQVYPRLIASGAEQAVYLAGGGNRSAYRFGGQSYMDGLADLPLLRAAFGWDDQGWTGGVIPSSGAVSWFPSTKAKLEQYASAYLWQNARIVLEIGEEGSDGSAPASWDSILTGRIASTRIDRGGFVWTVADLSEALNRPLDDAFFAGTGGLEGPAEARNRLKRRSFGKVFNVEARILDEANNIFEFGDPNFQASSVQEVRDMGRAASPAFGTVAWQGSAAATFAALQASSPAQGSGIVAPSIHCVKWWTIPAGPLTVDFTGEGGAGSAPEVAGALIAALGGAAGATIDNAEVIAADALRPDPAGIHLGDGSTTLANALDQLLMGVSLAWIVQPDGKIALRPITLANPVESIVSESVAREQVFAPHKSRRLGYQRNHRQHNDGEIAASILYGDIDDLNLDNVPDGTSRLALQPVEKIKLTGVEEGATANLTDSYLLDLANSTGLLSTTRANASNLLRRTGGGLFGGDLSATQNLTDAYLLALSNATGDFQDINGRIRNYQMSRSLGANLIANPDFAGGSMDEWQGWTNPAFVSVKASADPAADYVMNFAPTAAGSVSAWAAEKAFSQTGADEDGFAVTAGRQYRVAIDMERAGSGANTGTVRVRLYWYVAGSGHGSFAEAVNVTFSDLNFSMGTYKGTVTAPAGAYRAWLYVLWLDAPANAQQLNFSNVKVREISYLSDEIDGDLDDLSDGINYYRLLPTERTKLGGVATGATANLTDSYLLDLANSSGVLPTARADASNILRRTGGGLFGGSLSATQNLTDAYLLDLANSTGDFQDISGKIRQYQAPGFHGPNLILNPSFENGSFANWKTASIGHYPSVVEVLSTTANNANYLLRLRANGGSNVRVWSAEKAYSDAGSNEDGFKMQPGMRYRIEVDVRKGNGWDGTFTVALYYWAADGTHNNGIFPGNPTSQLTGSFQTFAYEFTAPSDSVNGWLYLRADGATTSWVDVTNVKVVELDYLAIAGSGIKLGDSRNLNPVNAANAGFTWNQVPSYTTTTTLATVTFPAATLRMGDVTISYNAMSVDVPGSASTTKNIALYIDDPTYSGGSKTLQYTQSSTTALSGNGRILIGTLSIVYPASGSGGGSGTGGGGFECTAFGQWILTRDDGWKLAEEIIVGDHLWTRDDEGTLSWQPVQAVRHARNHCVMVEADNGHRKEIAANTPLPMMRGGYRPAIDCHSQMIPTARGAEPERWAKASIQPTGEKQVAKISIFDLCYLGGSEKGKGIFSHNIKPDNP